MKNIKNIDTSKLNYIIYCRKSSEGEDKQVQSLETQLRELKEHASKNGLNIIETITESKSAHSIGRDGFNRMMELIRTGKADAILVIRANRISRNPIDAGYVISLMDDKKLLFIRTPNSTCYTCSSSDKMMIALELIFSKKDSDDKGDMVKEGQKTKALKGYPHGVASLGFLNDKTEEKGNRRWKVDHWRLSAIKTLLKMFLTGTWSAGKLYTYAVEELKLTTVERTKLGGALISRSRIYDILTDPIYAGFFYYDNDRYELNESLPRLITENEHNKIKEILSKKNIPKTQHHNVAYSGFITDENGKYVGPDVKFQVICDCKNKFAYRNKLFCPMCNTKIGEMENPKYLKYVNYYSVTKKKNGIKYASINEKDIDAVLSNFLLNEFKIPPCLVGWSRRHLNELKQDEIARKVMLEERKEERKSELEVKKYKLRVLLRDGKISDDNYKSDCKMLELEYSDTQRENKTVNWSDRANNILDLSSEIAVLMNSDDSKAKINILSRLGSNLVWNDEKLFVINKNEVNVFVKGLKEVKPIIEKFEPKIQLDLQGLNEKTDLLQPAFSIMLRE